MAARAAGRPNSCLASMYIPTMQAEVITACSRRGIIYKLMGIDHGIIVFKQAFRFEEGFIFNKPGNSLSNQQLSIMPLPLSHILMTPG